MSIKGRAQVPYYVANDWASPSMSEGFAKKKSRHREFTKNFSLLLVDCCLDVTQDFGLTTHWIDLYWCYVVVLRNIY